MGAQRAFIVGKAAVLAAAMTLATPAEAAEPATTEVEVVLGLNGAAPRFSRAIAYGTKFNLVTNLPPGSEATIEYWPRRRRGETCDQAYAVLNGPGRIELAPADQDSLVTRLGVPGQAEVGKPVKYTFTIDRLLVGLRYCFKISRTTFRPLDEAQRKAVAETLQTALRAALLHHDDPEYFASGCDEQEMVRLRRRRASVTPCMVSGEFRRARPSLAALRVQHLRGTGVVALETLIEELFREEDGVREEAQAFLSSRSELTNRTGLWAADLASVTRLRTGATRPELRTLLAPLDKLPADLSTADAKEVTSALTQVATAQEGACTRPDSDVEGRDACALLTAIHRGLTVRGAVDGTAFPQFAEFVTEVTMVRQVDRDAADLPVVEPPFQQRFPFYISLDAGLAFVPFKARTWGVTQYFAANFYFVPVDREERLYWRHGRHRGRELLKRVSLSLGITTTGGSMRSEDGVEGVVGKQFLMAGGGLRLTNMLRVSVGAFIYRQTSRNPAGGATALLVTPYLGLSLDLDVFAWIRRQIAASGG